MSFSICCSMVAAGWRWRGKAVRAAQSSRVWMGTVRTPWVDSFLKTCWLLNKLHEEKEKIEPPLSHTQAVDSFL